MTLAIPNGVVRTITRAMCRAPYLIQEINKLLQLHIMKVVHKSLELGLPKESIKSGFKPLGGSGNVVQAVELTGNGRRVSGSLTEIHGGKS